MFRPVATRGAVLYFCTIEMITVNDMYIISLAKFIELYEWSVRNSDQSFEVQQRVSNIEKRLTLRVYEFFNMGLLEKHKTLFKLFIAIKILIKAGKLNSADLGFFLKAGGAIGDLNKPFSWMDQKIWYNLKALSKHKFGNQDEILFE